ncbi:hypothetical protein [Serratia quinivorans]|uniref:hypothetical protein n=1 Tax=Serratia quinivorans TaxID=137545 RepID=UPI0021B700B2|nr:hypothetical protein [Serratia quinivorans]
MNAVSSDIREVVKKSHRGIFKRLLISTKRGLVMGSPAKQTIIAQMPDELAVAAECRVVSCADTLDFIARLKTEQTEIR